MLWCIYVGNFCVYVQKIFFVVELIWFLGLFDMRFLRLSVIILNVIICYSLIKLLLYYMQCVTAIILIIDHIYKKKLRHINFRFLNEWKK